MTRVINAWGKIRVEALIRQLSTWHVWGDYIHTVPERIGNARRVESDPEAASVTARSRGFDFDYRTRNGFEPWAATFESTSDDGVEFSLASCAIVHGWQRVDG
jgi:hypothetical protein